MLVKLYDYISQKLGPLWAFFFFIIHEQIFKALYRVIAPINPLFYIQLSSA
ncbi:hypothetical protein J3U51_05280 [Gilliamella sp. B3781]|uniref:hypothetical protein n=1 Tax=unclassified Gilliamella TaxID=2685620 RepID=UPI002269AE98|nr:MULTISPECIES: hypothetical protein [unclassified Gilliamella]MCX8714415.1 hypothetical protein [Gilliamella sp. B3781]MCX8727280.1 hypothetical protein [Gilliamella sp. B2838]